MLEGKITYYQSDQAVIDLYRDGWRITLAVFDPTVGQVLFICERQQPAITPDGNFGRAMLDHLTRPFNPDNVSDYDPRDHNKD